MFKTIHRLVFAYRIKRTIKTAREAVYSENFDITSLSRNIVAQERTTLLRAYIAIRVAADTKLGIETSMQELYEEIGQAEVSLKDHEEHLPVIEYQRLRSEASLLKAEIEFMIDKRAPEYSYRGALYRYEQAQKGPISYKEAQKLRFMTTQLDTTERQLEQRNKDASNN